MTSDMEAVRAMLDRAGIVYLEEVAWHVDGATRQFTLEAREGPNNHGYWGFSACLYFNDDKALVASGAWE